MPEQARYTVKAPNGQTYSFNARAGLNRRQAEAALERAVPAAFQQSYTVRADDGQTYRFNAREGMSQSEARRALHRAVPETDRDRNAIGAGWAAARTALTTGLPYALDAAFGIVTPEEEARYRAALQESARIQEERLPGGAPSIGDMTSGRSDFFGGLMENLGQSIPQAVPAVIGGIGGAAIGTAVAPGPGTLAGGIGGVLGGVGASAPFFAGSNVARATEGGQTALTRDAAGRALAVAPLQAGADVLAAKFIPGLNRVFGGPVTNTALANLARPGLARGAVRIGQGAVAGGAAEAGQQFGERYAAGLPLGDPEAMREYGESAALGAIMDASIGVAGAPFSGRRDGAAPSPAGTPPPATDFGTEEDTAKINEEIKKLAPEQKVVFAAEYNRLVDEGLSQATAALTALDKARKVPVTTAQGTEDVASDGRPDGEGVPSSDARSELGGTAAGPEGTAAGDVGVSGGAPTVGVQGESNVDGSLTAPPAPIVEADAPPAYFAGRRAGRGEIELLGPEALATFSPQNRDAYNRGVEDGRNTAAPVAEGENLTPTAPTAEVEAAKAVPDVATPSAPKQRAAKAVSPEVQARRDAAAAAKAAPAATAAVKPYVAKAAEGIRAAQEALAGAPLAVNKVAPKAVGGEFKAELNDGTEVGLYFDKQAGSWFVADPLVATNDLPYGADNTLGTNKEDAKAKLADTVARARAATLALEQKALAKATPTPPVEAAPIVEPVAETPPTPAATTAPAPLQLKGGLSTASLSADIETLAETGADVSMLRDFVSNKRDYITNKDIRAQIEKLASTVAAAPEAAPAEAAKGKGKRVPRGLRRTGGRLERLPINEVEEIAKETVAGWKNAPNIIVVEDSSDIPGNESGVVYTGLWKPEGVYIVANSPLNNSPSGIRATVYHEILGHAGLRQEFGLEAEGLLQSILDTNPQFAQRADAWLAENPDAYTDEQLIAFGVPPENTASLRRIVALEEVLAEASETGPTTMPVVKRWYAASRDLIRRFANRLGWKGPNYSNNDIRAIMQRAHDNVVKGGNSDVSMFGPDEARASKPKKTPATPIAPLTPAAEAKAVKKSKEVVTVATKTFSAVEYVDDSKKAADANYAAGNMANHMPLLKDALSTMNAPAFKKWLEVMPLSRMAEWGEKNVPGLVKLYHMGTQKIGQLHNYQRKFNDITQQLVDVSNKHGQEVIVKLAYYARISRVDVNDFKDTLKASYDADRPLQWITTELTKKSLTPARRKKLEDAQELREKEIEEVFDLWQKLGEQKGGREAYLATQRFYKTMYAALKALNYSAMRRLNTSESTLKEMEAAVDKAMDGEADEATGMPSNLYPREYTPAKRFGEFWLDIAADTSKGNKRERIFATFDTAGERDAALRKLAKKYKLDLETGTDPAEVVDGDKTDRTRVISSGNSMKELQTDISAKSTMLKQLFEAIDNAKQKGDELPNNKQLEALKDSLFQTWLMSSSANSLQRNFIATEGLVAGFSQDLARVFGDSAMQYSSLLASAEYDHKIENQIKKLRADIKEQKTPKEQARYRMFVDEMENRLVQDYAAQNGPNMFNSVNRAMFFYFLTAPATAAAQWVSLPGVVVPFLGADYGYGKATAAFTKNLNFAKTLGANETNALGEKVFSLPSMRNSDRFKNDPLFRKAYLAGAGRAVFETMVDVITSSAATPAKARTKGGLLKNAVLKTNEAVTGVLSAVYTSSELVTREVAYMTAFDLHYAKTGDFNASVDAAVTAVNKSMGSYLDIERPTFMKYSAIRSLMAFKQYAIAMTTLYMDLVAKIATGKGERLTAAKQLAGITAMGALLGGVPGTMVFGLIGSTFGIAMKAALDDEEKEAIRAEDPLVNPLDNFEAWFRRKWLPETYGTGLGDIVENGVISELTGADFASRLSNSNMWFRDGKPGETPSQNILNTAAANIPPLSMAMSVADAFGDFSEGKVLRGTAKIMPAFLRGGVNAVLLNKQGVESPTTGDTSIEPEELNMADIVSQTLGFVPMKVSDFRKESFAFQGARTEAGRAKTRVMGNLYRVLMDENAQPDQLDRAVAAIERHNMRYPPGTPYFIDEESLQKSLERQESSDERTYRGMMLRDEEQRLAPLYEADR